VVETPFKRRPLLLSILGSAIGTVTPSYADENHMVNLTPIEQLMHATVRIEGSNANGQTSSGTGFFYSFFSFNGQSLPAIITNKHVLRGLIKATLFFTIAKPDGSPDIGNMLRFDIPDISNAWIGHADAKVDLAILPIADFIQQMRNINKKPFLMHLDQSIIPDSQTLQSLLPMEEILVIGYPDGIWDSKNNAPIFRRGITATAPYIHFDGESIFLVDCAIFPGSSGSPVFLYNAAGWITRNGNTVYGQTRVMLLGVVYAVAQHSVTGQITIVQAPTATLPISVSAIPNNLGICVMASRILEFETQLMQSGIFTPPPGYKLRASMP
jgi:hypothetical protein